MKLWRCDLCHDGKRAPERMARNDARRYCLGCTERTGKLVERSIPAKQTEQRKRDEANVARLAKRATARTLREAAERTRLAMLADSATRPREDAADWLRARIAQVLKLTCWDRLAREYRDANPAKSSRWRGRSRVQVTIRQGGPHRFYASGRAWWWEQRLVVTTGYDGADDLSTLVHEVAHLVAPADAIHDRRFRRVEAEAIAELTGQAIDTDGPVYGGNYRGVRRLAVRAWLGSPEPDVAAYKAANRRRFVHDLAKQYGAQWRLGDSLVRIESPAFGSPEATATIRSAGYMFAANSAHTIEAQTRAALAEDLILGTVECTRTDCDACAALRETEPVHAPGPNGPTTAPEPAGPDGPTTAPSAAQLLRSSDTTPEAE